MAELTPPSSMLGRGVAEALESPRCLHMSLAFRFVGLLTFGASALEKRRSKRKRPVPSKAVFLSDPLRFRVLPCASITPASAELRGPAKSSSWSSTSGKGMISSALGVVGVASGVDERKKGSLEKKLAEGVFLCVARESDFDLGLSMLAFGEDGAEAGLGTSRRRDAIVGGSHLSHLMHCRQR